MKETNALALHDSMWAPGSELPVRQLQEGQPPDTGKVSLQRSLRDTAALVLEEMARKREEHGTPGQV